MTIPFRNSIEQKKFQPTTKFKKKEEKYVGIWSVAWKKEKSRELDKNSCKQFSCGPRLFNVRAWHVCIWNHQMSTLRKILKVDRTNLQTRYYGQVVRGNRAKQSKLMWKKWFLSMEFGVLYALCSLLFFTEFMFVFVHDQWPHHTVFRFLYVEHLFSMFSAHHIAVCTNSSPDATKLHPFCTFNMGNGLNFMMNNFT